MRKDVWGGKVFCYGFLSSLNMCLCFPIDSVMVSELLDVYVWGSQRVLDMHLSCFWKVLSLYSSTFFLS